MTEIETRNGRKFRVWHGRVTAVQKDWADTIMRKVFEDYCRHSVPCPSCQNLTCRCQTEIFAAGVDQTH